jgi:hypothetical protein
VPAPPGAFGAPRRAGQCEELTCQVSLPGPSAHLPAPVTGKLSGLIWMHVIRLCSSRREMALTAGRHRAVESRPG